MSHVIDVNGNIKVATEINLGPLVVTSDATLDGNYRNVLADASGGNITITLPATSTGVYEFRIKKIDSTTNIITVDGNGSEQIDGALTQVISSQYVTLVIVNNATAWWII